MSRLRIISDPTPALLAEATRIVNERYNAIAAQNIHRDAAHAYKRTVAVAILAGGETPTEFAAEAKLRGMTPVALAADIAGRPNEAAQRELDRQRELIAIAAATKPADLPQG